jgi:uncharacterized protein YcfJ
MNRITRWLASAALVFTMTMPLTITAVAQDHRNFYDGARHQRPYYNDYDRRYYHDHHDEGGIGPGKGALIGGAAGAALGAVFGGGLKGALVAGAAGAGVGAIAGKANQDSRERDYRERYDRYGRPY